MRRHRSLTFAAVTLAACALTATVFGHATLSAQDPVTDQYKVFTAALSAVEHNYLGEVQSDRLVYSAISGMLQTLDPHSSFMDPRSFAQMRERQEGRYYGLGVTIRAVNGDITACGCSRARPRMRAACAAATSSPRLKPKSTKGWNTKRCRQDQGTEGHERQHRHPPRLLPRLIPMRVVATRCASPPFRRR